MREYAREHAREYADLQAGRERGGGAKPRK